VPGVDEVGGVDLIRVRVLRRIVLLRQDPRGVDVGVIVRRPPETILGGQI
jgi:hypothetical protein